MTFSSIVVSNIESIRAQFSGEVTSTASVGRRGYVYSITPNPDNLDQIYNVASGPGELNITISSLQYDTDYYIRPYSIHGGTYYYGAEVSFHTMGYKGPSGGWLIFDKGNNDGGWQFLETPQSGVIYNTWGCQGSFVGGTVSGVGFGPAYTSLIVNDCSSSSCAARICNNLVTGGQSDWFLPSTDETVIIFRSVGGISSSLIPTNYLISSKEFDATHTDEVFYSTGSGIVYTEWKSNDAFFIPCRRY